MVPQTHGSAGAGSVSSVLAGTPLENARITGRLGALIDHYGQVVVDEIHKNDEFYDDVAANLMEKFESDSAVTEPAGPTLAMPTVAPEEPPAEDFQNGMEEGGSETEGDTSDEGAETGVEAEVDPVTIVIVADLHCNVGMGRISGLIADTVEADMILDLGDDVIGGTSVEGFCIDAFAKSFGDRPVVVAGGNHDSSETADQQRAHGWHVLAGEPIEVNGIRFLGDLDPTLTSLGAPTRLVADENLPERGHRLSERACEEKEDGEPIDIHDAQPPCDRGSPGFRVRELRVRRAFPPAYRPVAAGLACSTCIPPAPAPCSINPRSVRSAAPPA